MAPLSKNMHLQENLVGSRTKISLTDRINISDYEMSNNGAKNGSLMKLSHVLDSN